jgi:hypothetical protein
MLRLSRIHILVGLDSNAIIGERDPADTRPSEIVVSPVNTEKQKAEGRKRGVIGIP